MGQDGSGGLTEPYDRVVPGLAGLDLAFRLESEYRTRGGLTELVL